LQLYANTNQESHTAVHQTAPKKQGKHLGNKGESQDMKIVRIRGNIIDAPDFCQQVFVVGGFIADLTG
jgi:hypothetical protein